jgi:CheY-like chemotaxis protein
MIRPCFLVIDHEYPGNISSRKLVLETAKYNVITVYSADEAVDTFRHFPNVAGVVLNEQLEGMDCVSLVQALRAIRKDVPLILTSSQDGSLCEGAPIDHFLRNFDPAALLALLGRLVPNPFENP